MRSPNLACVCLILCTVCKFVSTAEISPSLLINGGYTPLENSIDFENDLIAFSETIAQANTTILNASGPGTLVPTVDSTGYKARNPSGVIALQASSIKKTTQKATLENYRNFFEKIKNPTQGPVKIYYTDHGDREIGVALYEEEHITAKERLAQHKRLSEDTTVCEIDDHCYAEAAVIDPHRKLPTSDSDWKNYLSANYRKKSCALMLSSDNEMTHSMSIGKNWDQGVWYKILNKDPKPTLKSLRAKLVEEKQIKSSIKTTSDVLAEDLYNYFCPKIGYLPLKLTSQSAAHSDDLSLNSNRQNAETESCIQEDPADEKKLKLELDVITKVHRELQSAVRVLAESYFDLKDGAAYSKEYERVERELETLVAEMNARPIDRVNQRDEGKILKKYDQLQNQKMLAERRIDYITNFLDDSASDWIGDRLNIENFKNYLKEGENYNYFKNLNNYLDKQENLSKHGYTILEEVDSILNKTQGEHKRTYRRNQGKRRAYVESFIKSEAFKKAAEMEPGLNEIKEYYESIKICEETPLK